MIGDIVILNSHRVTFGSRSVSLLVSATLGLLKGPRVTDTDDSRESPLRSAVRGLVVVGSSFGSELVFPVAC